MCIIIDTNKISAFFRCPSAEDEKPIHDWLKEEGKMVYSAYGDIGKELMGVKEKLESFSQAGRATLIAPEEIKQELKKLKKLNQHKSNDVHILALAKASGARLLYTADKALMEDFKKKEIIDEPRGKIYSSENNKNLLTLSLCKKPT